MGCSDVVFIDCRFPYEHRGGHIINAVNIPDVAFLDEAFETISAMVERPGTTCLAFYCEHSTIRAPRIAQAWRERDRRLQEQQGVPFSPLAVQFPLVFLLHGGYCAFFRRFSSCHRGLMGGYVTMNDEAHAEEAAYWHRRSYERKLAAANASRTRIADGPSLLGFLDDSEPLWPPF
jgi:M-phase inducer tyrosine phosphatase